MNNLLIMADAVAAKLGIPRIDVYDLPHHMKATHKSGLVRGYGIVTIPTKINGKCRRSYAIWNAMLQRCADDKLKRQYPTYADCSCDRAWQLYRNFDKWYAEHYVEGWHLDKDILVPGNKIYGPSYCRFVPSELNLFFTRRLRTDDDYPQGVQFDSSRNKLVVRFHGVGGNHHIGRFELDQVKEAEAAYKEAKSSNLLLLAKKYKAQLRPDVYKALIWRADNGVF